MMSVTIEIESGLQQSLEASWGNLAQAAKEALAIESYRNRKLSLGGLAKMLDMGVIQADSWLKDRGVMMPWTEKDIEQELATVEWILQQDAQHAHRR